MNEPKLYPRGLTIGNPLPGCVVTTWPRNDLEPPDDLGGSIHVTFLGRFLLSFWFGPHDWAAPGRYKQLASEARAELYLRAHGNGTGKHWTRKAYDGHGPPFHGQADPLRWEKVRNSIQNAGLFRCENCRRITPTEDCPYCKEEEK